MAITQLHQQRLQDQTINSSMSRQSIQNGNFDVWQRGTTVTTPTDGQFLADRWQIQNNVNTPPTTIVSRQSLTPGDIANSYYFIRTNVNGAGVDNAGNYYGMRHKIEHGTRFLAGSGKTVTVSFWARSSITNKKIGMFLRQDYGSGGSPTSFELINGTNWTLTSTWTKYTHTFTTNTLVGKTFGTDFNDYLDLEMWSVWGSTYQSRFGASTSETFVGSGNIDIAQVQLCAGSEALPFEPKNYAQELKDCQRYCQSLPTTLYRLVYYAPTQMVFNSIELPTYMRVAPSTTTGGVEVTDWQVYTTTAVAQTGFTLSLASSGYGGVSLLATKSAHGLTDGLIKINTSAVLITTEL